MSALENTKAGDLLGRWVFGDLRETRTVIRTTATRVYVEYKGMGSATEIAINRRNGREIGRGDVWSGVSWRPATPADVEALRELRDRITLRKRMEGTLTIEQVRAVLAVLS